MPIYETTTDSDDNIIYTANILGYTIYDRCKPCPVACKTCTTPSPLDETVFICTSCQDVTVTDSNGNGGSSTTIYYLYDLEKSCLTSCIGKTFAIDALNVCAPCYSLCLTCSGGLKTECTSCVTTSPVYFDSATHECLGNFFLF